MDTGRIVIPEAEEILGKYFPVLDHGFVALIDYIGGDLAVERAARCSYTIADEVRDIKDTKRLIRYLYRHAHHSPFEMAEVTVHMGLPIFVARQLVRHRMASLNEFSGRYSVMPMLFYTPSPESVCYQSSDNKQGRSGQVDKDISDGFFRHRECDRNEIINSYIWGLKQGIARETARIDLPLSTYTYWYWKCDLRNLLHLIELRSDSHAQKEIRDYSDILAGIVQRIAPISLNAFQDYQMDAVTFTQWEMSAIRYLSSITHPSAIMWESPPAPVRGEVDHYLKDEYGVVGREAAEFWEKLKVRVKRDFSLDLSRAKPASHFMELVEKHAVKG